MQPADTTPLDQHLAALAAAVVYPPTPDIGAAVTSRLAQPGGEGHRRWRLAVAGAAAVSLLAAASAVLLMPDSRDAVADFLGLGVKGERIEILPPTATPRPGVSPTPTPPPLDAVAVRTTLEDAAASLNFEPLVPAGVEVTDVFLLEFLGVPGVVLRTPQYDLWQFENDNVFLGKGTAGGDAHRRGGGRWSAGVLGHGRSEGAHRAGCRRQRVHGRRGLDQRERAHLG